MTRSRKPLDIRAASLTPDQRCRMLALVEQDRRMRQWTAARAVLYVGALFAIMAAASLWTVQP